MKKTINKIKYSKHILAVCFLVLFFHISFAQASLVTKDEIIDLANKERKENNLHILLENDLLNKAAFLKAQDMIGNDYFAHTSPSGKNPWHWFEEAGYVYKYAGENLAMDFSSAEAVHRAWMKSQTHRENIVSEKFQEIGVATMSGIIDKKEVMIAVQLFGTRLSEKVSETKAVSRSDQQPDEEKTNKQKEVKIKEASISPWKGSIEDEMIVFVQIDGVVKKVEAIVGQERYPLEKFKEDMYMNLISLSGVDLNVENVAIKVTDEKGEVFHQIDKNTYKEYLSKKSENDGSEDDEKLKAVMAMSDSGNKLSNSFYSFNQNNFLILLLGVFMVTIFNVWILEKEEERLLKTKMNARTA